MIQRFYYGGLGGRVSEMDTEVAGQVIAQTFAYNTYGQRTTHTVDGRQRIIGFDPERGFPNSVSHRGSNLATAGFDGTTWALSVLSLPNGSTSAFTYDLDQARLKSLTHVWPTGRRDWTYQFDEAGRLTQVLNSGSTEDSYIYDSLNRLIGANTLRPAGAGTLGQTFTYDAFGNMLSNSPSGAYQSIAGNTANRWDPAVYLQNRLPSSMAAAYDGQGNLVQLDTGALSHNFAYDALGRAVRATSSSLEERTYYSADTLPVLVEEGPAGAATKRRLNLYDDQRKLVAQYESVGYGTFTWKRDAVHLGEKEVAEVASDGSIKTTLADHLGSPRFVVSPGGSAVEQKFTPFGERLISDQDAKQFALGYTGHLNGSMPDVIPMQHRNMLARFGRFTSPDPGWDQKVEDPQSWNLYSYCRNNPVMLADPDGRTIVVVSNDPRMHMAVHAALAYMKAKSKTYAKKIDTVEKSKEVTYIYPMPGSGRGDQTGAKIGWDPSSGNATKDDKGKSTGEVQSPANVLGHEISHRAEELENKDAYDKNGSKPDAKFGDKEEKRNIETVETPASKEMGEPTRSNHDGEAVPVESVTYSQKNKRKDDAAEKNK